MSTKYTPEPWKRSNYRPQLVIQRSPAESTFNVGDDKFKALATFENVDDAGRAVSCVNACVGIDTAVLEALRPGALARLVALRPPSMPSPEGE